MTEHPPKILVALDGSERSFKTVEYICNFRPMHRNHFVLHSIITRVPENYYDLKHDPFTGMPASQVLAWKNNYHNRMEGLLEQARMMMIGSGIDPGAIHLEIATTRKGVARDILDMARSGYDALLIRRRGFSKAFVSFVMGSVSTKLIEKARFLPVLVAGNRPLNNCLLLAIDGSDNAQRAVAFTARMVAGSGCRIVLCSVIREYDVFGESMPSHETIIRSSRDAVQASVTQAADILEKAGVPRQLIETRIIQGAASRAAAIIEIANLENCDTIVFGRKGRSNVDEFDIGRVPWKVIHGAQDITIWIVP